MANIHVWGRKARKPLIVAGYVLAAFLGSLDLALPSGDLGRLAILILIGTGIGHVILVIDRNTNAVHVKIDDSVGDVWDAGERAGLRRGQIAVQTGKRDTATVTRLMPRP